jgi:hypothetical protein
MAGLLAAGAMAALPEGVALYRAEIGGEAVGTAVLAVSCRGEAACTATWEARLRAPAEAGGRVSVRRVEVEVDAAGRHRGGRVAVREDGTAGAARGVPGAVPATLAEVVLLSAAGEAEACLEVFDEATGERGRACGRRLHGEVQAEVLGARVRISPGPSGFPVEVALPEQRARFVRDPRARVPDRPPRLHGTRVPGPALPSGPLRFCGLAADAEPARVPPGLPPPEAEGEDCRARAASWVARAAARGIPARTAVGVAWDGEGFAWHAWAEARVDGTWIPVDPSFGQAPARGPRFTLARFGPGEGAARDEAGRRILACWGRARVEQDVR